MQGKCVYSVMFKLLVTAVCPC